MMNLTLRKALLMAPRALGIVAGRAVTGPYDVQIDVTNRCNSRCVMCWLYSPFSKTRMAGSQAGAAMKMKSFKDIVDSLRDCGTSRVTIGGAGEPFMHKDIIRMIRYAKGAGLEVKIVTNGTMLTGRMAEDIVEAGLDELNVSLHAATPEVFSAVRKSTPGSFFAITDALSALAALDGPDVTITNVIFKYNFREIEKMVDLGVAVGADSLFFKKMCPIEGGEALMMGEKETAVLARHIDGISPQKLGMISNNLSDLKDECMNPASRRSMPCYAGWLFSKILVDGRVVACCEEYNGVMGVIGEGKNFKDVWNSEKYRKFRAVNKDVRARMELGFECGHCQYSSPNAMVHRALRRVGLAA